MTIPDHPANQEAHRAADCGDCCVKRLRVETGISRQFGLTHPRPVFQGWLALKRTLQDAVPVVEGEGEIRAGPRDGDVVPDGEGEAVIGPREGDGCGSGDSVGAPAARLMMAQVAPLTLKESGMKLLASLAERVSPMLTSEAALAGRSSHDASAVPLRRPPLKSLI